MTKAISGELQMFGMSAEDIREEYMNGLTAKLSGLEMVVASILSDCQEELAMGTSFESGESVMRDSKAAERVRKQLNVAKFILFEMQDRRESEELVLVNSDGKEIL
jgi:hypothetical protein